MIQSATNIVIVSVLTKYIKNFSDIMKVAAIQNAASVHAEDIVQIVGRVESLPKSITNDRLHKGFSLKDIRVGDTAIFSFSVIYDWEIKSPDADPSYKNLITYHGQEYWQADITKIFAVIRAGEIIMVNGYVMAEPFAEDKIIVSAVSKKTKGSKSSTVMHVGNPKENLPIISIKQGDTIFFNPMIVQKYQINNKPFIILQQHQVLGRLSSRIKK